VISAGMTGRPNKIFYMDFIRLFIVFGMWKGFFSKKSGQFLTFSVLSKTVY
jgi:hypothetical protein